MPARDWVRFAIRFAHAQFVSLAIRSIALASALLCVGSPGAAAQVQTVTPPIWGSIDHLGVDASTGQFHLSTTEVTIGVPRAGGIVHGRSWIASGWRDTLAGTIDSVVFLGITVYQVNLGDRAEQFVDFGGIQPNPLSGATLSFNSGTGIFTYTASDGAVALLDRNLSDASPSVTNFWSGASGWTSEGLITQFTGPAGDVMSWTYATASVGGQTARRPQSVSNNLGYQIHFTYADDSPANTTELTGVWLQRTKATGINRAYYYCADNAFTCNDSTGANWPFVTYGTASGGTIETVTDRLTQVTRYVFSSGLLASVRLPSSSTTDRLSIGYSSGKVDYVDSTLAGVDGATYTYSDASGVRTTTIAPTVQGATRLIKTALFQGWVLEVWEDVAGTRKTIYTRDSNGLVTVATSADGSHTDYDYDSRGNVEQVTAAPKSGSGLSNIVTSSVYPSICSNPKTCNKPQSITDARGFRTDFTYDSTHGGVTAVTSPAPSGSTPVGSGTRPETRFSYTLLDAYYKDAGGSIVQGGSAYRLTGTSACMTGSTCGGTSDETKVSLSYGSTGVANNLLPTQASSGVGTGALLITSIATYTPVGDLASVDGPLTGSVDTTSFYYDGVRQARAVVGPDPDGGSSRLHRVAKTDYNSDGQPTTLQMGSVSSPANWASLTVMQQQDLAYNSAGLVSRLTSNSLSVNPAHAITQIGYNGRANINCSAVRMNPSTYGSLPGSACNPSTAGAYGPDRIARPARNGFFQFTGLQSAYGTPEQRENVQAAYTTSSGELETLTDAEGNMTTYVYDGFSRIVKSRFPDPSSPGSSSTTDFEELSYDTSGRLTARRLRNMSWLYFCYDNLGRVSKFSTTSSDATCATPAVSYTYDNLGRTVQASQSGHTLAYVYDAMGRVISETQAGRTVTYAYSPTGKRFGVLWPDGYYVCYGHDSADNLILIVEDCLGSGPTLATFDYDNLGRRTTLTRGNGGVTTYAYDTASRLTVLATSPANLSYDDDVAIDYNPAGQGVTRTGTNSSYTFLPPSSFTDTYTPNGLNQYSSARGVTPTYDILGNMTYDGAKTYGYDYANRLVSASGSPTTNLAYDPAGRLYEVAGSSMTRFLYDGDHVIAEYNSSGTLLKRFVHGLQQDEPIVWLEGAGTGDRRYLYPDERGSIVAVEGAAVSLNKYDPYGVPASSNTGRFQYTGQMWLPEVGLYHFKARTYSPGLGRFMQTDPIGYAGGMNLYAYAGSDPLNATDPTGLMAETCLTFWVPVEVPNGRDRVTIMEVEVTRCFDPSEDPVRAVGEVLLWAAAKYEHNKRCHEGANPEVIDKDKFDSYYGDDAAALYGRHGGGPSSWALDNWGHLDVTPEWGADSHTMRDSSIGTWWAGLAVQGLSNIPMFGKPTSLFGIALLGLENPFINAVEPCAGS